ncbi:MAG TPA: hypothetical protein VMF09_10880 [Solirubrobacteraceae bacterium]|nr:hypothetical protein [Solirubrobacteraceae bacterium]
MPAALGILTASLVVCLGLAGPAQAAPSAKLRVTFSPDRLGDTTNVEFDVDIAAPAGRVPPPLTRLQLRYPRELGFAISGLGLETCTQQRLEAFGPASCPADSHMGKGSALAEVPFGPEIARETAEVAILRAPEDKGHIGLLFFADAHWPVSTEVAFPGVLLPAPPPQDESIAITVPLVPSLPEGPDVAIVELHARLGPRGLTYYEHTHGKLLAYHPEGILLPKRCPKGGFAFTATLTFHDAGRTHIAASVPCAARPSAASSG